MTEWHQGIHIILSSDSSPDRQSQVRFTCSLRKNSDNLIVGRTVYMKLCTGGRLLLMSSESIIINNQTEITKQYYQWDEVKSAPVGALNRIHLFQIWWNLSFWILSWWVSFSILNMSKVIPIQPSRAGWVGLNHLLLIVFLLATTSNCSSFISKKETRPRYRTSDSEVFEC